MKFLKVGRVAIITRGRYAGKKVRMNRSPMRRLQFLKFASTSHIFSLPPMEGLFLLV
jgi:hypothetical protein